MLEKLKTERISAMKEKNTVKKNILSTLIGEIELKGKAKGRIDPLSDSEIIKEIKKMVENNILSGTEEENIYIEKYLPKTLSDEDLTEIITEIITDNNLEGMKGLGVIMKNLNEKYSGQFDGKNASIISKNIFPLVSQNPF